LPISVFLIDFVNIGFLASLRVLRSYGPVLKKGPEGGWRQAFKRTSGLPIETKKAPPKWGQGRAGVEWDCFAK
jgi:hypothetical protein